MSIRDHSTTATNLTLLSGRLQERGALRYTPAGIPAIELVLAHQSQVIEAGGIRQASCTVNCLALGPPALLLKDAGLGEALKLSGFLASRSARNGSLVLHITEIDFLQG